MAKQIKGRKFFAATASAALVASAIVPVASAASVNDFNQVPSWAKDAVQYLVDNGSVQGDQNGNFNPSKNLTRAQAAEIITKELGLATGGSENYPDVAENNWFYNAVVATSNAGIFEGNEKGQFLPNNNLTRQEAAKVIVEAFGLEGSANLGAFADANKVPTWSKAYFETAVATGVINGKGNLLAPTDKITNAEFATMIKRAVDATANAAVESVSAINNTTVEVTFKEEIEDIKALDFAIEGLEVKNAVVKQTDAKTAVLTTSAQEGGKEYTVTNAGEKLGSFEGVSAVIPTKVTTTVGSIQGVIGKEVTLTAEVTVESGQAKAGIPVTFNIVDEATNRKNDKIEVVAYTDEDGVAKYSYTRYYEGTDEVVAYATDKSSVNDEAKVYWDDQYQLTIKAEDKTKVNNGDSVQYHIEGEDNEVVYVAFKENLDVEIDKVIDDVVIVDSDDDSDMIFYDRDLDGEFTAEDDFYPYYVDSKDYRIAAIILNDDGEASFTLEGEDATVTPIVYTFGETLEDKLDELTTAERNALLRDLKDAEYERTALQAVAEAATFEEADSLQIEVEAVGVSNAAGFDENEWNLIDGQQLADFDFDNPPANLGGRDYVVTVKDEDGDKVGKGFEVSVFVDEDDMKEAVYLIDVDGNVYDLEDSEDDAIELEADKNGQVKFTLVGESTGYATPTIFIDEDEDGELDKKETSATGARVYFKAPSIKNAELKFFDEEADEIASISASNGEERVEISYISVDQNGKRYYDNDDEFVATFSVTAKTTNVIVENEAGDEIAKIKAGKTDSIKVNSVDGVASIYVHAATKGNVTVKASSTSPSLGTVTKTLRVVGEADVADNYAGAITDINTTRQTITFDGKDPVKYDVKDDEFFDDRNKENEDISGYKFEDLVKANLGLIKVKFEKGEDGNKWTILSVGEAEEGGTPDTGVTQELLDNVNIAKDLVSLTQTKLALRAYSPFAELSEAYQTEIATTILAGTYATTTALKTDLDTEITAVKDAIEATSTLNALIISTQALHDGAAEGTAVGQYAVGSKLTLQTAIDVAQAAYDLIDATTTATSINGDISDLQGAVTAFNAGKVTASSNALGAVNVALTAGVDATSVTVLEENKTQLGYAAAWDSISPAEQLILVGELATSYASEVALRNAINAEVQIAKNVPAVESITFDGTDLVITFTSNVVFGETLANDDTATIAFNDGTSDAEIVVTQTATGEIALGTNTITIKHASLADLAVGNTIKSIVFGDDTASAELEVIADSAYGTKASAISGKITTP